MRELHNELLRDRMARVGRTPPATARRTTTVPTVVPVDHPALPPKDDDE